MLDGRFRGQIETWVRPIGMSVKRAGVPADAITCVGLLMSVGCAVAVAAGNLPLGLLLLVLTGIPDTLDGAVAKAAGTSSQRGAFFDSVSDRVTDALVFGGIAWYLTSRSGGALVIVAFAAFATATLPSYIRAKAEALGLHGGGGLVERAERFIILGLGLLFSQLLVASLVVLIVLNLATAAQRFAHVWRDAAQPVSARPARPVRRRSQGVSPAAERWRARRADAMARARDRRGY
jgi:CDP-diacylglycerol--glycerol-3-phosphate 3-phosphatidyltransferase